MFTLDELRQAHRLVGEIIPVTPTRAWPLLAKRLGTDVVVKHENHAPTGAFKARGGLTYMDRFKREHPQALGVISATRGNHGQSLAHAGRHFGVPVAIVVPRGNSVEKNAAMRAYGAELIEHGEDFQEAAEVALRLSRERGLHMVPSFHRDLVLGVATYALEMMTAAPDLDVLYVPIGMGSGVSACIMARDLLGLKTKIVGVQADGAPAYALSFAAGAAVSTNTSETFADGVATRKPDATALSIILKGAARVVTVSDEAIAEAIVHYWHDTHNLVEGAGAAPLAAALKEKDRLAGRKVGLVLSGGNIDLALFAERALPAGLKAGGNHDFTTDRTQQ
jgi:threonine dehydratase